MMSNEYGLTVYNNNNGLMFDTRRGMNSYVVTEVSTGTGPSVPEGTWDPETQTGTFPISDADFVFVKLPASYSDSIIYYNAFESKFYASTFDVSYANGIPSTTWGTPTEATLDFFTVKHSSKVSSTDDYGLIIYNDDGTIQFDSRSVQQAKHFQITSFIQPGYSGAWGPSGGGSSLGSLNDYWEISSWTNGSFSGFGGMNITGIWGAGGGPYAINYSSVSGGGDSPGGFPGGSTTSSETWGSKIYGQIMSAQLI